VRSQEGVARMVELAEALAAPVIDNGQRMNFPNTHDLDCTFLRQTMIRDADVILLLEVADPWGALNSFADPYKTYRSTIKPDTKVISVSMREVYMKANFQDIQRYQAIDLPIGGDVQATLPDLIEAIRRATTSGHKTAMAERAKAVAKLHHDMRERDKQNATLGWDASPISTARLAAETWQVIKNEKWSNLVSDRIAWARRLWPISQYHHTLGGSGGAGQGYAASAAVGAALANRDNGIISVTFQPDGDMMYAPSVLWSAAHHKIPLLMVMHNNRCYHQEIMHVARHARRAHGGAAQPPTAHRAHRHRNHQPRYRLRQTRAEHGGVGRRPDQRPFEARRRVTARDESGEKRRAGAGGCGLSGPIVLRVRR
jgi:acetolactate synthase I/II/III large subunit